MSERIRRAFAMPNADTFGIPPIGVLVRHWTRGAAVVVDPFARNSKIGTHRNDLNPNTTAQSHEDARVWLQRLLADGVRADVVLMDPPYSPRQISECYAGVGRACSTQDTQNARLYKECVILLGALLVDGGVAIRCGWNALGFGAGFKRIETIIVDHGGAHNATIVTVDRKQPSRTRPRQIRTAPSSKPLSYGRAATTNASRP